MKKPVKVILWSTPRSLSTVLTKCLSFVPHSQIWYEPFVGAMRYGSDARYTRSEEDIDVKYDVPAGVGYEAKYTDYLWYKHQLEADFLEKEVVIVKANSYAITTRYDAIPDGYKHSFLIRHPLKVLTSWKKCIYQNGKDGPYDAFSLSSLPDSRVPSGYFFKEMYDLYQHIKDNYDSDPVVLDGDDLAMNPDTLLKAYCNAMGLPYTDDLLQWNSGYEIIQTWQVSRELLHFDFLKQMKTALTSSEFRQPSRSKEATTADLCKADLHCLDYCMPYYEKLRMGYLK
ncbi:uncharacterized protein [Amphiura filiformis]|uniref:uncharacterized protein n=1 Tax=Amphiura filiformis TaxID=82378 RepID=UPI003B21BD6E